MRTQPQPFVRLPPDVSARVAGDDASDSTRDEGARWGRDLAFVVKIKKTQESTPSVPVMPKKNNRDEENIILPFFTTGRFGPLPLIFSLRPPIHPYLTHRPPIHPSAHPSATHPSTLLSVACYTPPLPTPSTYLSAHTSHTTNSSLLLPAKSKPRLLALREEVLGIKVLRVPGPAVQGRRARAPSSA